MVGLTNVIAMATFDRHGLAVLDDGTVRAWGDNDVGQLGDGTTDFRLTPVPVVGLTNVIAVAAGLVHSLALLDDGTVCAWGGGEGATPQHTPVPVVGLTNVIAVAAGEYHNLALLGDGTVRGWGLDLYGYLGTGLTTAIQLTPVPVVGLTNVIAVAAGTFHTLALLNDGTVRALGLNGLGQLGDGAITEAQLTPVPVVGLTNVRNVAAGANHSLAMVGVLP